MPFVAMDIKTRKIDRPNRKSRQEHLDAQFIQLNISEYFLTFPASIIDRQMMQRK